MENIIKKIKHITWEITKTKKLLNETKVKLEIIESYLIKE